MTNEPFHYKLDKKSGLTIDQYGWTKEDNELFKKMSFDESLGNDGQRLQKIFSKMAEIRKTRGK